MVRPRHTARGIVIHDGQLLLMERFRRKMHYFSIPGGGIEAGETSAETVVREIREETSCRVTVERPLYVLHRGAVQHHIYLCTYHAGTPALPADAPEAQLMRPDNRFIPRWLPLDSVPSLPFLVWRPVQRQLQHDLQHGFATSVIEIVAEPIA